MAIINSMGVGRAKKSMGNVTYRTIRGRTIGSQKRSGATTRATFLTRAQALFGMVSMFMQAHASDIEVSFNKSQYGSQRNYFFRINKAALEEALSPLLPNVMANATYPTVSEVENAITSYATKNPTAIFRVKLSGFENVYLTGSWMSSDNPISGGATDGLGTGTVNTTAGETSYDAPIALSMEFHSGARIVRPAGTVKIVSSVLPSGITASDISYLTTDGNVVTPAVTVSSVTSAVGSLQFSAPELTAAMNVLAIKVSGIYIRLVSAYTSEGGVDQNPFG